jgi:GNAT superfamily N-acetyltransferase
LFDLFFGVEHDGAPSAAGSLSRLRGREKKATMPGVHPMPPPTIRPAHPDEYDAIALVWMNSWVSTGLEDASNFLLAKLRARIPMEMEKGWSLFVADDGGKLAAMLALHLPNKYLDQLFVAPEYQGKDLGRRLLAFTRQQLPREIYLRCVRENEKAWRWYEREGFVFEKEQVEPMTGFVMKYYRWQRQGAVR